MSDASINSAQGFFNVVARELEEARMLHDRLHSAHEGYGVLKEELDEFWDEVRRKQGERDPKRMLKELVQVAAMAGRVAEDVVMPMMDRKDLPGRGW